VAGVLYSPVHGRMSPADLAAWVLADRLPVRVQLQVHKVIWGPDTRGV
jgi:7-carboxy-7-deazaguanine synthase